LSRGADHDECVKREPTMGSGGSRGRGPAWWELGRLSPLKLKAFRLFSYKNGPKLKYLNKGKPPVSFMGEWPLGPPIPGSVSAGMRYVCTMHSSTQLVVPISWYCTTPFMTRFIYNIIESRLNLCHLSPVKWCNVRRQNFARGRVPCICNIWAGSYVDRGHRSEEN